MIPLLYSYFMPLKVNKSLTPPIVSRETIDSFKSYYELLYRWNKSISLMKISNWDEFYQRHMIDSIQLCELIDKVVRIIDIGSGAGIPGIPLSIMGYNVTMVESTLKKTTFLKQSINSLKLNAHVISDRIENTNFNEPVTVTARALTSLENLLSYMENVSRETVGIFLKGKTLENEIVKAKKEWLFDSQIYNSITGDGYIIKVTNLKRKST
ncbi:MAG: 16S rRNA (guanine(527)-N(7))-methyltransferase RsmG [Alphaproteobacteria bacterium CG_4_10_14_0_8_um_filter_37_21]|nr:MAG: 16S rRNA (guanine(527)-N(7))-methyltransferase RsmG [Alphaproteobacteria bacterium CG_4_10_14_0_8_um_filter_37_21]